MPSERTLALPLPLFQRAREDLGSAAYEALSSDLGWARWMSPLPARSGERIPPSKSSRIEPLNRSSRRKEALISLSPRSLSLLTSAATNERFMSRSSMRLLVSVVSRLAAAVVLLALLAPPRWSSILLAAEQRVVDPKALPKF